RTIALWLIALASIDRWLLSSANQQYRKMSSLKNAYSSMLIVIVFSMMLYAQLIYCYQANLTQTPLKCYGKTEICRMITDFSYAVITIVIPIIVMIIFGLLTISNVQNSYRRICITTIAQLSKSGKNQSQRCKKTDYSLLLMLLVQTVLCCFFILPQAIQKMYSIMTAY
ncbi:unnamed protein product, partial [Rotaria sp. Silwood1]